MATKKYGANVGFSLEQVVSGAGAATTNNVELTVDLATSIVNDNGTTRAIQREEVLVIMELFIEYIVKSNWLP